MTEMQLTEKQIHCPHCHYPFKPIMVNHLITPHVKDYCKVFIGRFGKSKELHLMSETKVGLAPTIQVSDAKYCPSCGRKLNNDENKQN